VTTIVRYDKGSSFPEHPHPQGEEIFVLEGIFSDSRGDHKVGTFLLNPEGFVHAPFSKDGCIIFVRLRQYAGERPQRALNTSEAVWEKTSEHPGITKITLFRQDPFKDISELQKWQPGVDLGKRISENVREIFVVDGEFSDEEAIYPQGTWLLLPPGSTHTPKTARGCTLLVKERPISEFL